MARKAVRLTQSELKQAIHEAVMPMMNENDAAAYAKVTDWRKTNDEIAVHGIDLEAADAMISPYKDTKFMFYFRNLRQNTGIVVFSPEKLFELTESKAVLKGNMTVNHQQANGRIIVDVQTLDAVCLHSKRKYPLEIDNRFVQQWKELCLTLHKASQVIP